MNHQRRHSRVSLSWFAVTVTMLVSSAVHAADTAACGGDAAVQILGSGGPTHGGERGSAAYLLWYKGKPSVVVDMGGGTTLALARAGVQSGSLDAVLLSHLHPDHVSDLPEFLWSELVAERKRALVLAGPSGGNGFPSTREFVQRLLGESGPFSDMKALLAKGQFELDLRVLDAREQRSIDVLTQGGLKITAYPVPHGRVPALAYRIDGPNFSVVFGGDQTALESGFSQFAREADLLVLHAMLTSAAAGQPLAAVVALPDDLGKRAAEAGARRVVLGHLMGAGSPIAPHWSLSDLDSVVARVRAHYDGEITVASDLSCTKLR